MALLTVMRGLPLAYKPDMQEDKDRSSMRPDTVTASLDILARMMGTVSFDPGRFEDELNGDHLLATELADYLVRKGIPFREAHGIVGDLVAKCAGKGCSLGELPLREYTRRSSGVLEGRVVAS